MNSIKKDRNRFAVKIGKIVLLAMFAVGMLIGMTLGVILGLLIAQAWPPPSERS